MSFYVCALHHLSAGQPGRGMELSILCWINTALHPHNCYWFNKFFNVVSIYNKMQTNLGTQCLISHGMEPQTGALFIKWGVLVVPALVAIYVCMQAPSTDAAHHFHTLRKLACCMCWIQQASRTFLRSIFTTSAN